MKRLLNPSYACLLLAVAVVAWGFRAPASEPSVRIENASGDVQLVNSKDGSAIFTTANLAPGQAVSGTVQLSNTGSGAGDLDLTQSDLVDTPGPGLGLLSGALQLTIQDVTVPGSPVTVFSGPPSGLANKPLGALAAGQSRTYNFTASLPAGTANSAAGSRVSMRYVWKLEGDPGNGNGGGGGSGSGGSGSGGSGGTGSGGVAVSRMPVWTKVDTRKWSSKGLIYVKVKCKEACTIAASAAAKGKPAVRTRRKSVRAKAKKWVTVKVKLSKSSKRALVKRLKRRKSVPMTVTLKVTDPRRAVRTIKKKAAAKRPKKKRR